jgi:hypothetical protein
VGDNNLFTGLEISKNAKELNTLKKIMAHEKLIYNVGIEVDDIIYTQALMDNNDTTPSIMDSNYRKKNIAGRSTKHKKN